MILECQVTGKVPVDSWKDRMSQRSQWRPKSLLSKCQTAGKKPSICISSWSLSCSSSVAPADSSVFCPPCKPHYLVAVTSIQSINNISMGKAEKTIQVPVTGHRHYLCRAKSLTVSIIDGLPFFSLINKSDPKFYKLTLCITRIHTIYITLYILFVVTWNFKSWVHISCSSQPSDDGGWSTIQNNLKIHVL